MEVGDMDVPNDSGEWVDPKVEKLASGMVDAGVGAGGTIGLRATSY